MEHGDALVTAFSVPDAIADWPIHFDPFFILEAFCKSRAHGIYPSHNFLQFNSTSLQETCTAVVGLTHPDRMVRNETMVWIRRHSMFGENTLLPGDGEKGRGLEDGRSKDLSQPSGTQLY
jgi:hypothetical protein